MGAAKLPPGIQERSGSFQARPWDPNHITKNGKKGGYRTQTFPTKAAAMAWKRDTESALAHGKLAPRSSITVEDEAQAWDDRYEKGAVLNRSGHPFKPSVGRTYKRDIEKHIVPAVGSISLSQLGRRDIRKLLRDPLIAGGMSNSRWNGINNALHAVLARALEDGELLVDPTAGLRLPVTGTRERAAAPAEFAELLEPLPEDLIRPLYGVAGYGGLRRGELRGLRWGDVDDQVTVISVAQGWDDREGPIAPKSKKGTRTVPVPSVLRLLLLEHKARCPWSGNPEGLVFGRSATEPFTPTHITARATEAWKQANLKRQEEEQALLQPIGLHECRHTYVSLMHDAGFPLERIGDYVGHSSAYMTDRYRHLLDGHEAEAAERFDAYLASPRASQGR